LRKPEGAAEPGEASPALVAARCFIRWKAAKPHGRAAREARASSASAPGAGADGASARERDSGREANDKRARSDRFGSLVGGRFGEHREVPGFG